MPRPDLLCIQYIIIAVATVFPQTSSDCSNQGTVLSRPVSHNTPSIMISSSQLRWDLPDSDGTRLLLPSIAKASSLSRPNQATLAEPVGYRLPSPFVSIDRAYLGPEKHSSLQSIHRSSFTPRQDHTVSFPQPLRPSFSAGPDFTTADCRSTQSSKAKHPPQLTPNHGEQAHSVSGNYLPRGHDSSHIYQDSHLPPGQMPWSVYDTSLRHLPSEYDSRCAPDEHPDLIQSNYKHPPARHYEPSNHQEAFNRVSLLQPTASGSTPNSA